MARYSLLTQALSGALIGSALGSCNAVIARESSLTPLLCVSLEQVFDSSHGRGPFSFSIGKGQVIQGWDEGIMGMRCEASCTFVIIIHDNVLCCTSMVA